MKKTVLIIVSIVTLIVAIIIGGGIYIVNTPEYAIKKMIKDVNDSGLEGLYPYLTDEAKETIDTVSSITDNNIVNSIIGLVSQSEYINVLKSEIQEIQWEVKDVLKSKESATVILSFNYKDKLIGTIELSMIREDGDWRIDELAFPKFDEINW